MKIRAKIGAIDKGLVLDCRVCGRGGVTISVTLLRANPQEPEEFGPLGIDQHSIWSSWPGPAPFVSGSSGIDRFHSVSKALMR